MKPACPKCQRFYRPKKSGTPFIEMKPVGSCRPVSGTAESSKWEPYKLWHGDLWECLGCGSEIIVGVGMSPISECFRDDWRTAIASFNPTIKINDC